jgi:Flp pilus assembly protein TadD
VLATLGIVTLVAFALQWIATDGPTKRRDARATEDVTTSAAAQPRDASLAGQFERGVRLLQAGHHERAAGQFHAVLQRAPALPEAHVNLGFALLGLGRAEPARDAFQAALNLRPMQANAYWGLAVSLEELCDVAGALGAMRTFVHLADPDSPFLRRANAALWEWESGHRCRGEHSRPRD